MFFGPEKKKARKAKGVGGGRRVGGSGRRSGPADALALLSSCVDALSRMVFFSGRVWSEEVAGGIPRSDDEFVSSVGLVGGGWGRACLRHRVFRSKGSAIEQPLALLAVNVRIKKWWRGGELVQRSPAWSL